MRNKLSPNILRHTVELRLVRRKTAAYFVANPIRNANKLDISTQEITEGDRSQREERHKQHSVILMFC